jgi:hypothetical protein
MALNKSRIWLGGLAGGVVWTLWSFVIGMKLGPFYAAMQQRGIFLARPRYPMFPLQWILMLFVLAILVAHLYAWARATVGAGAFSAFKIGAVVGFFAGFPGNLGTANWSVMPRVLPLGWMLDMWVGCILAALVAGFLYKD